MRDLRDLDCWTNTIGNKKYSWHTGGYPSITCHLMHYMTAPWHSSIYGLPQAEASTINTRFMMDGDSSANASHNTYPTGLVDFEEMHVLSLHHVFTCHNEEEELIPCSNTHCETMCSLLEHMRTCVESEGEACNYPLCASSRWILAHWEECGSEFCPLCAPLQQEDLTPPNLHLLASTYATSSTRGLEMHATPVQCSCCSSAACSTSGSDSEDDN